jgi:hypothetical protein
MEEYRRCSGKFSTMPDFRCDMAPRLAFGMIFGGDILTLFCIAYAKNAYVAACLDFSSCST